MEALQLCLITFNCARALIQPEIFAQYILSNQQHASPPQPDFIVLYLQEIAPIGYAFLGGSFVAPYFNAFRQAIKLAAKDTIYVNTISQNVGLTGIMVFVRQDLATKIVSTQVAGVGVGIQELGNKGAVGVRVGYRDSDANDKVTHLTFVSAHLAPFEEAVERRNRDFENIVRRLVFTNESGSSPRTPAHVDESNEDVPLLQGMPSTSSAVNESGTQMYTSTSHLFFAGDFNYRTSRLKPTLSDRLTSFPQPGRSSTDPLHFSNLLAYDQLTQEARARRTLHGLTEAPIAFAPTYKYSSSVSHPPALTDTSNNNGDSNSDDDTNMKSYPWATHRWPSWCDRIFYLELPSWMHASSSPSPYSNPSSTSTSTSPNSPPKIQVQSYRPLPLFRTSDHRPVSLSLTIPSAPIPECPAESEFADSKQDVVRLSPPYPIDPSWRARRRSARRKEIVVGVLAYLVLTWEGRGLLVAGLAGGVGGWVVLRSLLF